MPILKSHIAFPVSHIKIPDEDIHYRWVTFSFPVRMTCKGAYILTRNGDVAHQECTSSPRIHIVYTGWYSKLGCALLVRYISIPGEAYPIPCEDHPHCTLYITDESHFHQWSGMWKWRCDWQGFAASSLRIHILIGNACPRKECISSLGMGVCVMGNTYSLVHDQNF